MLTPVQERGLVPTNVLITDIASLILSKSGETANLDAVDTAVLCRVVGRCASGGVLVVREVCRKAVGVTESRVCYIPNVMAGSKVPEKPLFCLENRLEGAQKYYRVLSVMLDEDRGLYFAVVQRVVVERSGKGAKARIREQAAVRLYAGIAAYAQGSSQGSSRARVWEFDKKDVVSLLLSSRHAPNKARRALFGLGTNADKDDGKGSFPEYTLVLSAIGKTNQLLTMDVKLKIERRSGKDPVNALANAKLSLNRAKVAQAEPNIIWADALPDANLVAVARAASGNTYNSNNGDGVNVGNVGEAAAENGNRVFTASENSISHAERTATREPANPDSMLHVSEAHTSESKQHGGKVGGHGIGRDGTPKHMERHENDEIRKTIDNINYSVNSIEAKMGKSLDASGYGKKDRGYFKFHVFRFVRTNSESNAKAQSLEMIAYCDTRLPFNILPTADFPYPAIPGMARARLCITLDLMPYIIFNTINERPESSKEGYVYRHNGLLEILVLVFGQERYRRFSFPVHFPYNIIGSQIGYKNTANIGNNVRAMQLPSINTGLNQHELSLNALKNTANYSTTSASTTTTTTAAAATTNTTSELVPPRPPQGRVKDVFDVASIVRIIESSETLVPLPEANMYLFTRLCHEFWTYCEPIIIPRRRGFYVLHSDYIYQPEPSADSSCTLKMAFIGVLPLLMPRLYLMESKINGQSYCAEDVVRTLTDIKNKDGAVITKRRQLYINFGDDNVADEESSEKAFRILNSMQRFNDPSMSSTMSSTGETEFDDPLVGEGISPITLTKSTRMLKTGLIDSMSTKSSVMDINYGRGPTGKTRASSQLFVAPGIYDIINWSILQYLNGNSVDLSTPSYYCDPSRNNKKSVNSVRTPTNIIKVATKSGLIHSIDDNTVSKQCDGNEQRKGETLTSTICFDEERNEGHISDSHAQDNKIKEDNEEDKLDRDIVKSVLLPPSPTVLPSSKASKLSLSPVIEGEIAVSPMSPLSAFAGSGRFGARNHFLQTSPLQDNISKHRRAASISLQDLMVGELPGVDVSQKTAASRLFPPQVTGQWENGRMPSGFSEEQDQSIEFFRKVLCPVSTVFCVEDWYDTNFAHQFNGGGLEYRFKVIPRSSFKGAKDLMLSNSSGTEEGGDLETTVFNARVATTEDMKKVVSTSGSDNEDTEDEVLIYDSQLCRFMLLKLNMEEVIDLPNDSEMSATDSIDDSGDEYFNNINDCSSESDQWIGKYELTTATAATSVTAINNSATYSNNNHNYNANLGAYSIASETNGSSVFEGSKFNRRMFSGDVSTVGEDSTKPIRKSMSQMLSPTNVTQRHTLICVAEKRTGNELFEDKIIHRMMYISLFANSARMNINGDLLSSELLTRLFISCVSQNALTSRILCTYVDLMTYLKFQKCPLESFIPFTLLSKTLIEETLHSKMLPIVINAGISNRVICGRGQKPYFNHIGTLTKIVEETNKDGLKRLVSAYHKYITNSGTSNNMYVQHIVNLESNMKKAEKVLARLVDECEKLVLSSEPNKISYKWMLTEGRNIWNIFETKTTEVNYNTMEDGTNIMQRRGLQKIGRLLMFKMAPMSSGTDEQSREEQNDENKTLFASDGTEIIRMFLNERVRLLGDIYSEIKYILGFEVDKVSHLKDISELCFLSSSLSLEKFLKSQKKLRPSKRNSGVHIFYDNLCLYRKTISRYHFPPPGEWISDFVLYCRTFFSHNELDQAVMQSIFKKLEQEGNSDIIARRQAHALAHSAKVSSRSERQPSIYSEDSTDIKMNTTEDDDMLLLNPVIKTNQSTTENEVEDTDNNADSSSDKVSNKIDTSSTESGMTSSIMLSCKSPMSEKDGGNGKLVTTITSYSLDSWLRDKITDVGSREKLKPLLLSYYAYNCLGTGKHLNDPQLDTLVSRASIKDIQVSIQGQDDPSSSKSSLEKHSSEPHEIVGPAVEVLARNILNSPEALNENWEK